MATSNLKFLISIFFINLSIFTPQVLSDSGECEATESNGCNDKAGALTLKIIAIASILGASMIGICAPLLTRSIPALHPDRSLFVIVKAFASGIILGTGFMHVLPDSFDMLSSSCLQENPWHKFPFTGFVAMLSGIVTLMIDSIATAIYTKNSSVEVKPGESVAVEGDQEAGVVNSGGHFHGYHQEPKAITSGNSQLLRYRVIAMVRFLKT